MREKILMMALVLLLAASCGCSESSDSKEPAKDLVLSGTVTDLAFGGPVAGATVSVVWKKITDMGADDDTVVDEKDVASATTDTNGTFSVDLVPLGKDEYYFVSAARPDLEGDSKILDSSECGSAGKYDIELKLSHQLQLQGVVKSEAGTPVSGAAVVYYMLDGTGGCRIWGYNLTSSAGLFYIREPSLLTNRLIVSAPNFRSTSFNLTTVDLMTNLTITLKAGSFNASVNGTAYDHWLNKAGSNMAILAQAAPGRPADAACISGPDGRYRMQLDAGRYQFNGWGYYEMYDLDSKYLKIDPEYHTIAAGNNSVDLPVDFRYPEG